MPTDSDLSDPAIDDPDRIESICRANPADADGPTDVPCGNDTVTYVFKPAGHRLYVCRDHAKQILRFGDDAFADRHPTIVECERCQRLTPRGRINYDKICEDCET